MTQGENEGNIIPSPRSDLAIRGSSLARRGLQLAGDLAVSRAAPTLELDLGNNVTMKLVLIPAGKFMMGSPESEKDRGDDEGPQHEVTISKPFYMGVYPVTRGQFATFVDDTGYRTDAEKDGWSDVTRWDFATLVDFGQKVIGASWKRTGFDQTDEHPVVCVSHNDAVVFCEWLGEKSGKSAKLPTEAQWEYACRAGSKTRFSFGDHDGVLGDYAWYANNSDDKVHPVGQKKPNDWGLYDIHGNVVEWCSDWYGEDYYANANDRDPQGPGSGTDRVLRGGGSGPLCCRSAKRGRYAPGDRNSYIGFRVSVNLK